MKSITNDAAPPWLVDAVAHLKTADPVLRRVIEKVGPCQLPRHRQRYATLVKSIISQQISTKAADSIHRRLIETIAPDGMEPAIVAALSEEQMQAAGLSPQKRRYLGDLTEKVVAGTVRLAQLHRLNDDEVIKELTQVKGIGVWTAQMFLIFSLNRPNVFPFEDLGIRNALRNIYRLKEPPDKKQAHQIAAPWAPYASIAAWYCWRSLEFPVETWQSE